MLAQMPHTFSFGAAELYYASFTLWYLASYRETEKLFYKCK